jgi:hypothetical protein
VTVVTNEVNRIADAVDAALEDHRTGRITAAQAVFKAAAAVAEHVEWAIGEAEDLNLLVGYARESIEEFANDSDVADPALVDYFDGLLRGEQVTPHLRVQLDLFLDRIDLRLAAGDESAAEHLSDLCRAGLYSHRVLLWPTGAAERIVDAAYRLRLPDALGAALSPAGGWARIANPRYREATFRLALNRLAHLAAEPEGVVGLRARSNLLDLAGYIETAGEAASRLPFHLLGDDDRQQLLEIHEARTEILNADPIQLPLSLDLLRDNRLIQGAVWQAFDARLVP